MHGGKGEERDNAMMSPRRQDRAALYRAVGGRGSVS